MKTLNTIQTIAKVGKIISKIVFILCLVGAIGSLVGIISLALIPDGIKIGGVTIRGLVEKNSDVSLGAAYTAMAKAIVICSFNAVIAKMAERYFANELEAGTPFTFEGAKEMLRLGVWSICVSFASSVIASIIVVIMRLFFDDASFDSISYTISAGTGIMFIILSLFCKYGAEIREGKSEEPAEE